MHESRSGITIGTRPAARRRPRRESVEVRLLPVDAGRQGGRNEIDEADPEDVATGGLGQTGEHDRRHPRAFEVGQPVHPEATGDIGIDRCPRDVLARLVDDQHVDVVERQRRHERLGVIGELALAIAAHVIGPQRGNGHDGSRRRFDRGDAAEQATRPPEGVDAGEQAVAHHLGTAGVDLRRARLLAEADDGHLGAAALDRAGE